MKTLLLPLIAIMAFTACAPSKKAAPANNSINTRPVVTKPVTVTEKPVKTVVAANPNLKMAPINGRWKFESSSEKTFSSATGQTLPEIIFNETDRRVTGTTGCNIFNGFFFTTGELFNFSPIAVKIKKCADITVEKYITGFFKNVGSYKTDGNKVYLYNKTDREKYVVFTRMSR